MAYKRIPSLALENVRILFRNFAGAPDKYNRAGGKRKFNVVIEDPELAEQLANDGWNVGILKPRDEDDTATHHLPVEVSYRIKPPRVVMISGRTQTELTEETIGSLDYADIVNIDVEINPSRWTDDDGNERIKAYLKEMYVTIEQSAFAAKYAMEEYPGETPFEDVF